MSTQLFAYGSNMAEQEMAAAAPGASFVGLARLSGFALEFRRRSIRWGGGAADIVEREGEEVWGVLYDITEDALAALDAKEGAGFAYRRRPVRVETETGPAEALAYEVIDKEPREIEPTASYAALIVSAAELRGLPEDYVGRLRRRLG